MNRLRSLDVSWLTVGCVAAAVAFAEAGTLEPVADLAADLAHLKEKAG